MTSVTPCGCLVVAALVALGPGTADPAAVEPLPVSLPGAVGGLVGQQHDGGSGHRQRGDYGRTSARDGVLRNGCHDHRYRYVVTPPTGDWTLETFLLDRTGSSIASGTYFSDSDPARNRATFRFCRYSTYPGRFKIRAKMHWYDGSADHRMWLRPSYFRLRRP
jgi:hypothetical protein